jgi:predicted DNA-binding transcriptional regulator AlpA
MQTLSQYLTTEQVAEIVHLTPATVRYWRHMNTGPKHFRAGGKRVLYRREDIDAWLDEQYAADNPETARAS